MLHPSALQIQLLHLQRQRHLAAHPVVNANFQLHRPNRDTARALIRNALDGLLTKAPILSKQIVGDLVEDLEQASGILIDDKKLKAYLESKYFSRFNPEVEKAVRPAAARASTKSTCTSCCVTASTSGSCHIRAVGTRGCIKPSSTPVCGGGFTRC
jgi:hypothetical protein